MTRHEDRAAVVDEPAHELANPADPIGIERFIDRVGRQIRWRRAEFYGLRGAFYGALVALAQTPQNDLLNATLPAITGVRKPGVGDNDPARLFDAVRLLGEAITMADDRPAASPDSHAAPPAS